MHAGRVPIAAAGFKDRARRVFSLRVVRGGEFENVESADARAVLWYALLRKANQFIVDRQDSTCRTRATLVIANERTARVFAPWSSELFGEVKPQRVVLIRR